MNIPKLKKIPKSETNQWWIENEINKKATDNTRKTSDLINILKEKNEELTDERNNLRKDNSLIKSKIISNNNINSKKEQDMKNKEIIINNSNKTRVKIFIILLIYFKNI